MKRVHTYIFAVMMAFALSLGASVVEAKAIEGEGRVESPVNLAVLIQDDLVPRVGNEIKATAEFIRALPEGSSVMVGYVRGGTLQVRQSFTTDLNAAAGALRIPVGSAAVSAFNPYVEVREAIKMFPIEGRNRNALLLISDGLDTSRGFDFTSTVHSIDLERAMRAAVERDVAVYTFYAPSVGLTSWNRQAVTFGQSALNRLAKETGGEAFFQGTSFVTFASYFERLSETLNRQGRVAY